MANDPQLFQKNYVTSVNLNALLASGQEKHRPLIEKAVKYLKEAQIDEGEDKPKDDMEYGGFGYQPGTRPDLSNTQFALDTLILAGVCPVLTLFFKRRPCMSAACRISLRRITPNPGPERLMMEVLSM